ncbi:MAG: hypothetical protein KJI71_04710 [Patescibacteria group bacterium]|nr:hypothetical protein [Patescibacteria group bacterium]
MNPLVHIFLTYFSLSFIIPEVKGYLIPIAVFSIILDVDHIPGFIKMPFLSKEERGKVKPGHYIGLFRTAIQEPIGIITLELIFLTMYAFGIRNIILLIAALSLIIHWLIDFLTVHTRPLAPINNKAVSLFFHTRKQRIISELVVTSISLILFLAVYI